MCSALLSAALLLFPATPTYTSKHHAQGLPCRANQQYKKHCIHSWYYTMWPPTLAPSGGLYYLYYTCEKAAFIRVAG